MAFASKRSAAPTERPERSETTPVARWREWYEQRRREVEQGIARHLDALKSRPDSHSPLMESVQYSLAQPGKRLRPILVLESCRACGGSDAAAWPAALAIECIHTFSLIHDDLPAMDDDDLRRGRPTNHVVYGDALAILAGDWLGAHAFELLAAGGEREATPALVAELGAATAAMVVGQAADIEGVRRPVDRELVAFIHAHKTARLIEAACRMGAICGGASALQVDVLGRFGRRLGLAFQIVDDVLDETGSDEVLGKRTRKDAGESKQTFPAAFGIEESRARARSEIEAALASLSPFGPQAERLRELAHYVIARDH